jgi:hypothetical protein
MYFRHFLSYFLFNSENHKKYLFKSDWRHDITEILLKVAPNTITTLKSDCSIEFISEDFMAIEKNYHKKLY